MKTRALDPPWGWCQICRWAGEKVRATREISESPVEPGMLGLRLCDECAFSDEFLRGDDPGLPTEKHPEGGAP